MYSHVYFNVHNFWWSFFSTEFLIILLMKTVSYKESIHFLLFAGKMLPWSQIETQLSNVENKKI
jgi:hypothetical protein